MASDAIASTSTPMSTTTTTTIPRNPSMGSLSSLVSFSYHPNGDKTHSHSLITAPCTRCGHAEPIRSLLAVVEKTLIRCSTCTTPASGSIAGEITAIPALSTMSSASESLQQTFIDLQATLARHGAGLEKLELPQAAANTAVGKVREPSKHPIVHDLEDLRQFTSAVTRLMRTLHEKSSRLDAEERALRAEREEVAIERAELARLRETLEDDVGGDGAVSRGRISKSIDFLDDVRDKDGKSMALSRTMSFATIDYDPELIWDDEKERELADLERRLVLANRNWSPKQEDLLPQVEQLREERRKAKKHGRYHVGGANANMENSPSRTTSIRTQDRQKRSSFSGAFSRRMDEKAAVKNRRGSAGDAAEKAGEKARVGSGSGSGSGAGNRLMRFFSGSKRSE